MSSLNFIIALILLLPITSLSQDAIKKNKDVVLHHLKKQYESDNGKTVTYNVSDTSLKMTLNNPEQKQVIFSYLFNSSGKCKEEKVTTDCDSCINSYLNKILSQKKYKWRKINENQYISSFSKALMIELPADGNEYTFSLLQTTLSKKLYKLLLAKQ
ncbi:MAG: hypothetical protein WBC06_01745 [Chitinophagaceae bacterium]